MVADSTLPATVETVDVDADIALVVDLDGTLSRTDTLHEALLGLVASRPKELVRLPAWLAEGRAGLKARLADFGVVDPETLPLNEAVIETVRAARAAGRRTALVSAADHRQVTAVAEATGLFDEAYGSAEGRNLKGDAKAAFLTDHFGPGMFDYIGDSKADLPVWKAARRAITVQAAAGMRAAAAAANSNVAHIDPPTGKARAMLKALRPHQWSKNALLFLPVLAAHDLSKLWLVMLGFLAFCLTASAVYVINDLVDLPADRAHPRKRKRPFAAGNLSAVTGGAMAAGLLLGALILGLATGNPSFIAVLALYLAATFAYSLWLKRKLIVDVLMLAGLYTVRIIAGGAAAAVELSPWMLGFSMFLFLGLAAVKRQAELTDQMLSGRESKGRAYEVDDLPILRGMALSASHAAVLVLALYISSDDIQRLYAHPEILWLICPMLLYWELRMVMATHRGLMDDDPIIYAATDRVSQIVILACIFVGVMAI
ncbi:MAG: UbiA family prenyltransferase [Pseudomonadota bacterium]